MVQVVVLVVEIVVVAFLVVVYRRLSAAMAQVSATASDLPEAVDGGEIEPVHLTGVMRARGRPALFVVVELDADGLWVRSRPRFLRLAMIVARPDVEAVILETPRRGRVPHLVFQPVAGRADGLGRFRFQIRGELAEVSRGLRRVGWPAPSSRPPGSSAATGAPTDVTG